MSGTPHIPCPQVVAQLWSFIDDELTPEQMALIREHLDLCSACYPHFDFQKAFREFMRRHAEQPVPPGLRRRIFQQLLEEDAT